MAYRKSYFILVAEDNPDDVKILRRALAQAGTPVNIQVVGRGEEVIGYLKGQGEFADREKHPIPHLILLDIKMPGLNGFDVLSWIRQRAEWKCIPVVVLTISHYGPDIQKAYELGANSFLSKDSNFDNFCASLRQMADFWLKHAILPRPGPFVADPTSGGKSSLVSSGNRHSIALPDSNRTHNNSEESSPETPCSVRRTKNSQKQTRD